MVNFAAVSRQNYRFSFITAFSALALLALLAIQVGWIVRTAGIRAELFNEKASLVLARVAESFKTGDSAAVTEDQTAEGIRRADSLIRQYLALYNLPAEFRFEVVRRSGTETNAESGLAGASAAPRHNYEPGSAGGKACFSTCVGEKSGHPGFELKLTLPDRTQFILSEMRLPFSVSFILVVVVMVLYWRTTRALKRETALAVETTSFLNNMTHELKTPLTNISLAARMIARDGAVAADGRLQKFPEIILAESDKLNRQVEEILTVGANDRGGIPLQREPVDLREVALEVAGTFKALAQSAGGTVRTEFLTEHAVVTGDRRHLTGALANLVENAIKYSENHPEVNITVFRDGKWLAGSVADKGPGIARKYRKKVFEKYFRIPTGDTHNVKGFGLGLAYVRQVAEAHGGRVTLESTPGKGSIFTVRLAV